MTKLVGNKLAQDYLARVLPETDKAQAYLVAGLQGLGKLTLIKILVAKLHQLAVVAALDTDPDFKLVVAAPDKKDITIDQVREVTEFLKLASWSGRPRVVVFNDAEYLNIQASNALLKTLEEPLGHALIFLVTSQPQSLLPTIRSRCQLINMTPVKDEDLERWLHEQGVAKKDIPELLGLSQGRPGLALTWLGHKDQLSLQHQLAQDYLDFIRTKDAGGLLGWQRVNLIAKGSRGDADTNSNVGIMQTGLDINSIWLEITRDLILCKYGLGQRVIYKSLLSRTQQISQPTSAWSLVQILEALLEAQRKLRSNANVKLTLEWVLITIKTLLI